MSNKIKLNQHSALEMSSAILEYSGSGTQQVDTSVFL